MWALLWARVRGWIWMAGAVLAVLAGAYAAGGRAARRANDHRLDLDALTAIRKSKENYETVSRMDDDAQLREFERLRDKRRR